MSAEIPELDPEVLLAHRSWARELARSMLIDEHQVDDLVQDTWLAALQANL